MSIAASIALFLEACLVELISTLSVSVLLNWKQYEIQSEMFPFYYSFLVLVGDRGYNFLPHNMRNDNLKKVKDYVLESEVNM